MTDPASELFPDPTGEPERPDTWEPDDAMFVEADQADDSAEFDLTDDEIAESRSWSLPALSDDEAWDDTPPEVGDIPARLLTNLNPNQAEAVSTLTGALLVVAGPGSGKTRVLTHRIAALVATGTEAWRILAVTFTNKAAGEMRERLKDLIGEDEAADMWVATFHSACARILRTHAMLAGLPKSFSIFDASDAEKVVKAILKDIGGNPDDARQWAGKISYAKNHLQSPEVLAQSHNPEQVALSDLMTKYQQRLTALGGVDFDDLLNRTLFMLQANPDVARRYQRRFSHVLVDEYQDTNIVQYELVRILAGGTGNLCVVGDADQQVYSWRGAAPQVFDQFTGAYPDAKVVVLNQNYRSTKAILETVQSIIDPNPALHRAHLWTENDHGDPVRMAVAPDDRSEAAWVVDQIRRSGTKASAHAVLFRTNAQSRPFEEELTKARVPYEVVGALRFYERAEIKDAVAYLRLAANPADAIAFARVVNTPRRGIGDATVATVIALSIDRGIDPITAVSEGLGEGVFSARAAKALAGFLDIHAEVRAACANGPLRAVTAAVIDTGLRKTLAEKEPERVENLDALSGFAATFIDGPSPTDPAIRSVADLDGWDQTLAFLESISLISAADDEDTTIDRVSLLTAHAAKGKEFDIVWVVGVEAGLYPHGRVTDDPAAIEEERRLLFVAASRARHRLTMSRCIERWQFGDIKENRPSPFLADLPDSVLRLDLPSSRRPGGIGAPARARFGNQRKAGPAKRTTRDPKPATGARPAYRTPLTTAAPAPTGPRLVASEVTTGQNVIHTTFGPGKVLAVDTENVKVQFADVTKVLLLAYAPLRAA